MDSESARGPAMHSNRACRFLLQFSVETDWSNWAQCKKELGWWNILGKFWKCVNVIVMGLNWSSCSSFYIITNPRRQILQRTLGFTLFVWKMHSRNTKGMQTYVFGRFKTSFMHTKGFSQILFHKFVKICVSEHR